MKKHAKEVGLFDAKTHLSMLINRVERGEEITITRRGVAVARLVPAQSQQRPDLKQVAAKIRELSRGVKLKGVTIRELIEEGRM